MASVTIRIEGAEGVHKMLDGYMTPKLPRRMQLATKAGATVFKAPLKAEARKVSKRMGGNVQVQQAKRDRPATIVKFGKRAWFDHFVIGGTRDHGPRKYPFLFFIPNWNPYFTSGPPGGATQVRAKRVRGVQPNPMVDRVADAHEGQAYRAIDQSLDSTEST